MDTRDKFTGAKWLGDIVIGPEFEECDLVIFTFPC